MGVLLAVVVVMGVGLARADSSPPTLSERAQALKETTLCPVCDGQTVVESNVPAAASIRALIDERVAAGDTDAQVREVVENTFPGQALSAIPPGDGFGGLVWVLPIVALAVGAAALVLAFRRWSSVADRRATEADRVLVAEARASR
ncbi:MAG: hypothetical protein GY708_15800 [Actinomycetia bacterium]|nr:hypothetical protein [Actinomycetes bacterium]MCP4960727.1 hypothetical protein [Actinomycetes bacterium]